MPDTLSEFMALGGWIWLSLAAVFLIAELLSNSTWFMWLGVAAGLTAVVAFVAPGLNIQTELVVFAGFALAVTFAGRRWFKPVMKLSPEALGINSPAGRMAGARGQTVDAFTGGEGRVRHGDTEWQARSEDGSDLAAGVAVDVVSVDGATLTVRARG